MNVHNVQYMIRSTVCCGKLRGKLTSLVTTSCIVSLTSASLTFYGALCTSFPTVEVKSKSGLITACVTAKINKPTSLKVDHFY